MLKIARELIDLATRIAELRGHGVERLDEEAELVLRLLGDLIVEVAGGDFARTFGKRFDRHGDLFREIERGPHQRKEKKDGEKDEDEEELALEGAKVLLFLVVRGGLELDFGKAMSEVAGHPARSERHSTLC